MSNLQLLQDLTYGFDLDIVCLTAVFFFSRNSVRVMRQDVLAKGEWDETWVRRAREESRLLLHSAIPPLSRLLLYTANAIVRDD